MNAQAVLDRLAKLGVTARADGGDITIQPASKVPSDLKAAVRENKPEILIILADPHHVLARLRAGSEWLADQHQRWMASDSTAADDAEFSRVWNRWWEMDRSLRARHGFAGCVHGPEATCPEGFPCLGCSEAPASVAAQLALAGV